MPLIWLKLEIVIDAWCYYHANMNGHAVMLFYRVPMVMIIEWLCVKVILLVTEGDNY